MHNEYWYKAAMYEKIAEARRVAAHDRLVLPADKARREAQQAARSPFARLVWMLATYSGGAVRRWRERSRPGPRPRWTPERPGAATRRSALRGVPRGDGVSTRASHGSE